MPTHLTIVGLGEALFDLFPEREVLGGAPLNVAVHAHQLLAQQGGRGVVVSRIGQDELGRQLIEDVRSRGMEVHYIQSDPDRPTGVVYVSTDDQGQPQYEIVRNVAWDWLHFDPDVEALAATCDAVCFGSLAQRDAQARNTIYRFLDAARRAIRLFDVNLRQDYYSASIIERSIERATAVKLNTGELPVVAGLLGLSGGKQEDEDAHVEQQVKQLIKRYALRLVAVTRGERGTVVFTRDGRYEGEPAKYDAAPVADAVGAGDACSAGLLVGLLRRWPMQRVVNFANHLGAFVAAQPGATPKLPDAILQRLER